MRHWNWLCWLLLAGCGRTPLPPVLPATASEVLQAVRKPGAKVVLVNLWATQCVPCREEFPDLVRLQREYARRGLRVVFVSWDDKAETAAQFLAQQGVRTPSFIKISAEGDQQFLETLEPRLTGALPATLVYDNQGTLRSFWEGRASFAEFEKHVQDVLNPKQQEAK